MSKSTSAIQIEANRKNAQKSIGPKTPEDKRVVAQNALKHGLFSRYLILHDEDPLEYQALLDGLNAALKPVGALEYSLVERIALALWRQRRLVRSETAAIELDRQDREIAKSVSNRLGIGAYSDEAIKENDLNGFDQEQVEWCHSVLAECEALDPAALTDLDQLKKDVPLIFEQLSSDAEDHRSIPDYLRAEWGNLRDYFDGLIRYCRTEISKVGHRPMILALAEMVRSERAILMSDEKDTLAKYQVMLDNELYKAMKALREAQEWRMKSIEAIPEANGFVSENASAEIKLPKVALT